MMGFGALVMGVFLSHALVFLLFGISFILYWIAGHIHALVNKDPAFSWKGTFSETWRLGLSVLPALILWLIYLRVVMGINSTITASTYTFSELMLSILRIRQLVGFSHEIESPAYIALFVTLVVLGLASLFTFIMKRHKEEGHWIEILDKNYIWVSISLLFLLAYFLLPDKISAGNLTHRFGLYFFLTGIVFLASHPAPRVLQLVSLVVVIVVMILARQNHFPFLKQLNDDIMEIGEMTSHMEEGSTVLNINTSDNWIHVHFQLYATCDHALIHLRNPQCAGQFPLIWNEDRLPECYVGDLSYQPGGTPDITGRGHRMLQVDFITIFYHQPFWEDEENETWHELLNAHYELVMTTSRKLGALYHRKNSS
jgi:hypothetical protein